MYIRFVPFLFSTTTLFATSNKVVNVLNRNLHTNKDHGKNVFRDRFTRFDDEDNSDQTSSSLREKNVENLINDYMIDINTFPLTKKVLGVPASSSVCLILLAIYLVARPRIFEQLVFCKLNENYCNDFYFIYFWD